jgi:hypothetical protein
MRWKGLLLCGALFLLGTQPLQAGFYYVQELYTPPSGGEPARTTTIVGFVSGPKVRAEDRSSKIPNVIITRLDQGLIRLLVPDKKVYVEIPIPGAKEESAEPVHVTVTQTTQTRKIGPYECTRFEAKTGAQTFNVWLSTDIDVPSEEVATYWQAGTRLYPLTLTRELAKLPGFPVRVELTAQKASVVTTVTRVAKQEVPAFLFEVPSDYQPGLTIQAPPEAPPESEGEKAPAVPRGAGARPPAGGGSTKAPQPSP